MEAIVQLLLILAAIASFCSAGIVYPSHNIQQIVGVQVSTGAGNSDTGTQRVILSADSPAGTVSATGSTVTIQSLNGNTTPIPVSGTFSATIGTVTIQALNGNTTPIPVSGSFQATGSSVTIYAPNGNVTPIPITPAGHPFFVAPEPSAANFPTAINGSIRLDVNIISSGTQANPLFISSVSTLPVSLAITTAAVFNSNGNPLSVTVTNPTSSNVTGSSISVQNVFGTSLTVNSIQSGVYSTTSAVYNLNGAPLTVTVTNPTSSNVTGSTISIQNVQGTSITVNSIQSGIWSSTAGVYNLNGAALLTTETNPKGITGSTITIQGVQGLNLNVAQGNHPWLISPDPSATNFPVAVNAIVRVDENIISTFSQANAGFVQTVSTFPVSLAITTAAVFNQNGQPLSVTFPSAQAITVGGTIFSNIVSTFTPQNPGFVQTTSTFPTSIMIPTFSLSFSSVTCVSNKSTQVLPPNTSRKGCDCFTLTTNTDIIFMSWDNAAASTSTIVMTDSENYFQNWSTGVSTTSLNCISNTGQQTIRCMDRQ